MPPDISNSLLTFVGSYEEEVTPVERAKGKLKED